MSPLKIYFPLSHKLISGWLNAIYFQYITVFSPHADDNCKSLADFCKANLTSLEPGNLSKDRKLELRVKLKSDLLFFRILFSIYN